MNFLNSENAFLNAEVEYNNKKYYVIKVNQKSVYLSENKDFLKIWKNRPKGITWKKFCDKNGAIIVKYGDIKISDIEVLKGKDCKTSEKQYLDVYLEKEVCKMYKRWLKGFENYSTPIEGTKGKTIIIIKFKDGQALIRNDKDYFFYDIELDKYSYWRQFGSIGQKKEIPFPRIKHISPIHNI
jgi:hypothetical protein